MFHHAVDDLTEEEWTTRPAPGQNIIGFNAWHMPRTQDNVIQTWIRGKPELAHHARWSHWGRFRPLGCGVGISLEAADEIAFGIKKADVLAYVDLVNQEAIHWLGEIDDDELDMIPEVSKHLTPYPEYQTPGYREEMEGLLGKPVWGLLMRPCIGHIHRHVGELFYVKETLRGEN